MYLKELRRIIRETGKDQIGQRKERDLKRAQLFSPAEPVVSEYGFDVVFINGRIALTDHAAVSYTHLDVYKRQDLENKLLMVDDDMDMSALPKTNYIKTIVTAECKMDMERKGVQSYQSQLYARFLCFGNGALTALHDQSDGFFRRQIVLTTKDRPADRTDDPFLVEKLMSEMESIFLWCLEGLHRLLANNYQFTISGQAIENVETVKRSSNNVIEFLQSEGYIRFKADSEASSKALYEAYKLWCEDNVRKPMSANRLSSELAQNERLYNVEATNNIYAGGKRVRGFVGIEVLALSLIHISFSQSKIAFLAIPLF